MAGRLIELGMKKKRKHIESYLESLSLKKRKTCRLRKIPFLTEIKTLRNPELSGSSRSFLRTDLVLELSWLLASLGAIWKSQQKLKVWIFIRTSGSWNGGCLPLLSIFSQFSLPSLRFLSHHSQTFPSSSLTLALFLAFFGSPPPPKPQSFLLSIFLLAVSPKTLFSFLAFSPSFSCGCYFFFYLSYLSNP